MLQGAIARTTNNRMGMIAAIEGLRSLTRPREVEVVIDSDYRRRGMTEFLQRWRSNGVVEGGVRKPDSQSGSVGGNWPN